MTRLLKAGLLATTCLLLPAAAGAQETCPEGRAANGQCVNAGLAQSMREAAVINSHPKLSYTHYPVLPLFDWLFRYPFQLNPNPQGPAQAGAPPSS
jgi:hypothetical protein